MGAASRARAPDVVPGGRAPPPLDDMEEMVGRYAPLVGRIARRLRSRLPAGVLVDDLVQSGMIGLLDAVEKYDVGKGANFEAYAGIRICGAMLDEVRRGDWAPRSIHRKSRRVSEAIRTVEARTGKDAKDKEIAAELDVGLDAYHAVLQDAAGSRLFSLERLLEEDGSAVEGAAGPCDGLQRRRFRDRLAEAIKELPEREKLVLALCYDEELSLREVGELIGVGESRVSQIRTQAALRLRARLSPQGLGGAALA